MARALETLARHLLSRLVSLISLTAFMSARVSAMRSADLRTMWYACG